MNKALIIVDVQHDYFKGGKCELVGSEEASLKIKKILENFRKLNLPIIHIRHLSVAPGSTFFIPETKGAEIHENVMPLSNEKIITKYYPNSFRETDLLTYLKTKNITDVVITGMMTHMCVDATTRAAKDFDFNCIVIGDACATRDLELNGIAVKAKDVHYAFLSALSFFYANVISTDEYLRTEKVNL